MQTLTPSVIGNEELLKKHKTTFLCSHKVPDEAFNAIRDWAKTLDPQRDCVLCGCLSGLEKFVLKIILEHKIPLIIVLAEALPKDVTKISEKLADLVLSDAMGEGRLLIASVNGTEESAATGSNAELRNRWMMDTAEEIVIGYALPYGKLDSQLIGRKNVKRLTETDAPTVPDEQQRENMAWGIYRYLRDNVQTIPSHESKTLLNRYLQLDAIKPSVLHSVVLQLVVRNYDSFVPFNFPAFLKLWNTENLRAEDWKKEKVNDHYLPSLADRVLARLSKAEPEQMDTAQLISLSEQGIRMFPKNTKYKLYRLNAALAEKDTATAIPLLKQLLQRKSEGRLWNMLADCVDDKPTRCSILCKAIADKPFDTKSAWSHLLLGELLAGMNHFPEALREVELYKSLRERAGLPLANKYQWVMKRIPTATTPAPTDRNFYANHTATAMRFIEA